MKTAGEISILEFTFQFVAKLWEPAAEAHKARTELGIRSLEETIGALERNGYEVCHVDLPEKVSGFAEVISDKRHIVLNRHKPPQNLEYTCRMNSPITFCI